jgi:hypothetical protein
LSTAPIEATATPLLTSAQWQQRIADVERQIAEAQ